mgnify:CR=1 FL=1
MEEVKMKLITTKVIAGQATVRSGIRLVVVESFAGVEKNRKEYANGETVELEIPDGSTTLTLLEQMEDGSEEEEEEFDRRLVDKEKASDGVHLALEQYIDAVSQDGQPDVVARYAGLLLAQRKHARAVELVEEFVDAPHVAGGE